MGSLIISLMIGIDAHRPPYVSNARFWCCCGVNCALTMVSRGNPYPMPVPSLASVLPPGAGTDYYFATRPSP